MLICIAAYAQGPFPMFNNRTHTVEAQPFADLSQQIWDLMAAKDADALKDIVKATPDANHLEGITVITTKMNGEDIDKKFPQVDAWLKKLNL